MELSPLARERLASIGELSSEEKQNIKFSEELDSQLADFFTGKLTADELWLKLRKYKEEGQAFLIGKVQLKILSPVVLSSGSNVLERCRHSILGCEVLKEQNNYSELESAFVALEKTQQQYQQEMDEAFKAMKQKMRGQVEMAAQQMAQQAGNRQASIDIEGSVDASIKTSSDWQGFMQKHDNTYNLKFNSVKDKIREIIN